MRKAILILTFMLFVATLAGGSAHAVSVCVTGNAPVGTQCPASSSSDPQGVVWVVAKLDQVQVHTTAGTLVPPLGITGIILANDYYFAEVNNTKVACADALGGYDQCGVHGVSFCPVDVDDVAEVCTIRP